MQLSFFEVFSDGRYKYLVDGLIFSLSVTVLAAILGIIIGIIIAIFKLSNDYLKDTKYQNIAKYNPFAIFASLYVYVIRGTPAVVQLMIINNIIFVGSLRDVSKIIIAGVAFGINSGAYVAEIIRSGIQGLDKGQMEAARALGMPYKMAMTKIILPQAVKHTLPTLVSEFIVLLKETSVVGFIGGTDLLRAASIVTGITYRGAEPLFAVALIYLALVGIFTFFMRNVERGMRKSD